MLWLGRLVVRRAVWVVVGVLLLAALHAVGVRASDAAPAERPAAVVAVVCIGADDPPGCDPDETPAPTSTPAPTDSPGPVVVVLAADDRDAIDGLGRSLGFVVGLVSFFGGLLAVVVGLRR